MNIVVLTYKGRMVVRPDTTWVRKDEDFYVPDFVDSISVSEVLCARISRPGKCIAPRFAERYYDATGSGLLLYADNLMDGDEEGYACASCLGHSSYVKMPETPKESATEEERSLIRAAIAEVSKYALVRTGDILAVEMERRRHLCSREDGIFEMPGFRIIF